MLYKYRWIVNYFYMIIWLVWGSDYRLYLWLWNDDVYIEKEIKFI